MKLQVVVLNRVVGIDLMEKLGTEPRHCRRRGS